MIGRSIRIGRVLGISIELDLSWFIVFFLVAWSLSMGYFPYYYPSVKHYWFMGIMASLLLFASVLLHELSHSWVAIRNGLPISKITLFIFGGVANMTEEPKKPGVEFKVAVAGPLCSYFLMFIFWFIAGLLPEDSAAYGVCKYVYFINGILATFNLVPGFPLDGGRILRSALWYFTGSLKKSTRVASLIGRGFAVFLMALGFLNVIKGNLTNGLWLIFIGLFLQNAAASSYQQVVIREMLSSLSVRKVMNRRIISVTEDIPIAALIDRYFIEYHFDSYPVMSGKRLTGVVRMADVKVVPRDRWEATRVGDVMELDFARFLLSEMDSVEEAFKRMVSEGIGWFMVINRDQAVVGILTRSDIMHRLRIKSDLGEAW